MAEEINTLLNCVEEYLAMRQIDKKKYLPSYLICAKNVWKHLFKNTIYAVNSSWFTLKKGTPYNYVDVPKGCVRLFSASVVADNGRIEELFYDNLVNIIPKPSTKKCGCTCECGGLCDDINSMTYTTKVMFTINGVDYVEKKWVKTCPNGDVIEYKETPAKKYNDFTGDSGDYMNDYNNDYDIGSDPFSNFTIETVKSQKIICKLSVKECGCPEETEENIEKLNEFCGCYLPANSFCKKRNIETFLSEINSDCRGRVKVSECGTKLYFIPDKKKNGTPEFMLLNWQTSGEDCGSAVQVPEYSLEAMFTGIHYYSIRFNSSYSQSEKQEAKYDFRDKENSIISFLNPLSLKWLSEAQDTPIKF